ncbi:hypothetical protein [Hymenobacter metallicola]|uniref:Uncharacterized protein n=1 Tax=Hymenobacter metallicola TaxID=2563114 RepID=A0A4Z0QEJ0_9BACT|nr:hypothetical protein [Hymenobacter metallicola]TGE28134.1 hypothetical protein E5K02_01320 [Hymenobacter metallicola]
MSFLRRSLFTAALVSSLTVGSFAQTSTPAAPASPAPTLPTPLLRPAQVTGGQYKDYLTKRYANDKEARAVVHLFGRKKTGGALWLATGAGVIVLVAAQTGSKTTSSGTTTTTVTPLGYGLLLGLFGSVGIGKLARFNNEKLYQCLEAYEKGHSFPDFVYDYLTEKDYQ